MPALTRGRSESIASWTRPQCKPPGEPAEGEVPFRIEEISHQFSAQAVPRPVEQSTAASCELDVNCYPDWAATAKGVALLSFEKDDGSYGCSGTLLNTRSNSFVPYLL